MLIDGFISDCRLRRMAKNTLEKYESILKKISIMLRLEGLSLINLDKDILKKMLSHFINDLGFSQKTVSNYFSALSTFFDYLIYDGVADRNIILPFRKRYLHMYKNNESNFDPQRKLISIEEMSMLTNSILDPRNKAILTLLAKTGIRRNELIQIDLDDINWIEQSIHLKPHPKRSNCTVFFDDECAIILKRWMKARKGYAPSERLRAFFVNERGGRLKRHGVYHAVVKHAERVGLHNPESKKMTDHFTPHCCRHWFTTNLRRNNMRREFIKELRGDSRNEAIDLYDHIDKKELKRAYLAAIPVLGIC
jgi:integrase/recombinase XerD